MQVAEVLALYDYNAWANARILDTAARVTGAQFVAPVPFSRGGLRSTLVHTLDAERVWRDRWRGLPPPVPLREEDFPDVGALAARWREEETQLRCAGYFAHPTPLLGALGAIVQCGGHG